MAELTQQAEITVADKIGKLAEVTRALKGAGINIKAICAWAQEGKGHMYMVSDQGEKACAVLAKHVEQCSMRKVVAATIDDTVGSLHVLADRLAKAGVAINLCYATAAAGKCLVVMDTSDNDKAARLI